MDVPPPVVKNEPQTVVVMPLPGVSPPVVTAPPPVVSVTYVINGRLVTVPAGQPLPPGLFSPAPQQMCPPGSLR